jgi:hypothetical protein
MYILCLSGTSAVADDIETEFPLFSFMRNGSKPPVSLEEALRQTRHTFDRVVCNGKAYCC